MLYKKLQILKMKPLHLPGKLDARPKKVHLPSLLLNDPPTETEADPILNPSVVVGTKSRSMRNKQSAWARIVGDTVREVIPSHRLPTNRIVMQRYNTLKDKYPLRTDVKIIAEELYSEILAIWEKAGIPTVDKKTCLVRLVRLLCSWKN